MFQLVPQYNIALLVDGPNFALADYDDLLKKGERYGRLSIKEIFYKHDAPHGALKDAMYRGFRPVISSIDDVDCAVIARGAEIICSPRYGDIEMLAIASADSDYVPLLYLAKEYKKLSMMLAPENRGKNRAIMNTPDVYVEIVARDAEMIARKNEHKKGCFKLQEAMSNGTLDKLRSIQ